MLGGGGGGISTILARTWKICIWEYKTRNSESELFVSLLCCITV